MANIEGILLKGHGGFYFVETAKGVIICTLRGKFRKTKQTFFAGDRVSVLETEAGKGVIEGVLPRINQLKRPPVANVNQGIITFAFVNPALDFMLLDRILIQIMAANIEPIICLNKADLVDDEFVSQVVNVYERAGFRVHVVSAETGLGIEELRNSIRGNLVVFAGPSGAGKSSLLNRLYPGFSLEIGAVSHKTERGKHTTRLVELLKLEDNTYVADTPGFSNLYLPEEMTVEALVNFYPEFKAYSKNCPYQSCLHYRERICGVKEAVQTGKIDKSRYERYITFLEEIKEREKKY